MELSPKQQTVELIKKSQRFLIIGHQNPAGDCLGSMLAFSAILKKLDKDVDAIITDPVSQIYSFLPKLSEVKKEPTLSNDLVIKIDTAKKKVDKISYNMEGDTLNIVVTPEKETIDPADVNFGKGILNYDVVIMLDTPDIERLDSFYDDHAETFFQTPTINIDHHASNEYYGKINLVDVTATSTAEILVSLCEALGANLMDPDIATCLLCGVVEDTKSFRNSHTTPKSMTVAAQLLAAGGRQQEIIQNLYRTKTLPFLKLWGKALSRVQHDEAHRLVWTALTYQDFQESGANVSEIKDILDELANHAPKADILLLLAEHEPQKVSGKLKAFRDSNVLVIAELFGGKGKMQSAEFEMNGMALNQAVEHAVTKIRDLQKKKIGIVENLVPMPQETKPLKEKEVREIKNEGDAERETETPQEVQKDEKEENKIDMPSNSDTKTDEAQAEKLAGNSNLENQEEKNENVIPSPPSVIPSLPRDPVLDSDPIVIPSRSTPRNDKLEEQKGAKDFYHRIDASAMEDDESQILDSKNETTGPTNGNGVRVWRGE